MHEKRSRANPLLAVVSALAAFTIFAGQFVFSKHGVQQGLTPYDMTALRFGLSGLIFLPFLWSRGLSNLAGVGWRRGAVLAALGGAPYYILVIEGLTFAPASYVVIINPGLTMLTGLALATLWLGENWSVSRTVAFGSSAFGLLLVGWGSLGGSGDSVWFGSILFAISGAAWGVLTVLLRRWTIDPLVAAAVIACLSLAFLPVYALAMTPQLQIPPLTYVLYQALYQGVLHSAVGIALFAYATHALGPGLLSLMVPVVPVIGLILSYLFLDEWLTGAQWFGALLVIVGMVLAAMQVWRNTKST